MTVESHYTYETTSRYTRFTGPGVDLTLDYGDNLASMDIEDALNRAYEAGAEQRELEVRHERHDGAWDDQCVLCDAERQADGQVYTRGKGWDYPS